MKGAWDSQLREYVYSYQDDSLKRNELSDLPWEFVRHLSASAIASHTVRKAKEAKAHTDAKANEDDRKAKEVARTLVTADGFVKLLSLYAMIETNHSAFSK